MSKKAYTITLIIVFVFGIFAFFGLIEMLNRISDSLENINEISNR